MDDGDQQRIRHDRYPPREPVAWSRHGNVLSRCFLKGSHGEQAEEATAAVRNCAEDRCGLGQMTLGGNKKTQSGGPPAHRLMRFSLLAHQERKTLPREDLSRVIALFG